MVRKRDFKYGLLLNCLVLMVLATDECDKSKCPGPLKHYKDLKCTPVYRKDDNCCPYKFNCDHLKDRPIDKCRVNNHDYNIGEELRDEDGNACDISCTCSENLGIAQFSCAAVDCPFYDLDENCYSQQMVGDCCPGNVVCLKNPEDKPTCEVDGKVYKDGDYFKPASEPEKDCHCAPGYKGDNVEPFCRISAYECGAELHYGYEIHDNCVPVYYSTQSPQSSCSVAFRCQNERDKIIKRNETARTEDEDEMTCQFGNMIMQYGDELNQSTDYSSVCVKCVCEVGPVPTCQRLPDNECEVTKHPNFQQYK